MKGTFFQRPLEFNLWVDGEAWQQGDTVKGSLTIKNHGSEAIPTAGIRVHLADGELKKVRLKSPDAFEVLSSASMGDADTIAPGGEAKLEWSFQTGRNCPITDTGGSLFMLYGQGEATEKLGQLQLSFRPWEVIETFLDALSVQFRFVVKSRKSSKGKVEVKLAPPSAKNFGALEQLVLYFHTEGDEALAVRYVFQVKKLTPTAVAAEVKKEKRETEQLFERHDYRIPSGRINHQRLESAIGEALSLVESKTLF